MSQAELADRTGLHRKTINAIINGTMSITADTAILPRAYFWYAGTLLGEPRCAIPCVYGKSQHAHIEAQQAQMSRFPIKEMQKRNLLPAPKTRSSWVLHCYSFLRSGDVAQWDVLWRQINRVGGVSPATCRDQNG
jgi:transcriptional regulator with XRE-family HTH domain